MTKPIEDDVRMQLASKDMVEERLDSLRQLFPEVIVDGKVDFERLRTSLGEVIEEGPERYGLSWAGKSEAIQAVKVPSIGTLVPIPGDSLNFNSTENVVVEGDNLEVLKLLQRGYHGKIKLISIDPPYNTGKEFIYPDNFHEGLHDYLRYSGQIDDEGFRTTSSVEANGRFHSRWLSMMYPRLFLARNLLRQDGCIFVSIDDHEVQNLRHLMDEIFGPENFIATMLWQKRYSRDNRPVIGTVHEYVLLYARHAASFAEVRNLLPPDEKSRRVYKNSNKDPKGPWRGVPMTAQGTRPNQMYEIVTPTGVRHLPPEGRCWSTTEDRYKKLLAEGRIWFGTTGDSQPNTIRYLSEIEGFVPWTWWPHSEVGHTDEAKKEVHAFCGKSNAFDTPKPVRLMKRILQIATKKDEEALVLDFFAGSGTMGEAVLRLNQEDGGNRRFVLVQLPEPTDNDELPTISAMAMARLRHTAEELRDEEDNSSRDLGFRLFRLTSSNFKIWDFADTPTSQDGLGEQLLLYADHVLPDRDDQDILYEIALKSGIQLSQPIEAIEIEGATVYSIEDGKLLICLASPITREVLRALLERSPERVRCLDKAFEGNDQLKANTVLEMRSHDIKFQTV